MGKIRTAIKIVSDSDYRFLWLAARGLYNNMSDEEYIKKRFKAVMGYDIDLKNPQTFNEKQQWRKLYDRKDIYTQMEDKLRSKDYVSKFCGEGYTFKLLGSWENPEDIDFDSLPNQFVLKVNHAGGVIICRDKAAFDIAEAVKKLQSDLVIDYFLPSREWPYKNVKRMVLAEEYMGEQLMDFKNYCFNGELKYTFVWNNHPRKDGLKPEACFCGAFDSNWEKTEIDIDYPHDDIEIDKPNCYSEMKKIVEKVSKDVPFLRVDCYVIGGGVYVGEMTFFPWGGFQRFKSKKWDIYLGELINLPNKHMSV